MLIPHQSLQKMRQASEPCAITGRQRATAGTKSGRDASVAGRSSFADMTFYVMLLITCLPSGIHRLSKFSFAVLQIGRAGYVLE